MSKRVSPRLVPAALSVLAMLAAVPGHAEELTSEAVTLSKVWFKSRPGQKRLTISMAVDRALAASPNLAAAKDAVESSRGDERTAGLRPNPSFTTLVFNANKPSTNELYQIAQRFETGGKRSKRVCVARLGTEISEWGVANEQRQIVARVREAFIRVLQALSNLVFSGETRRTFLQTKELKIREFQGKADQGQVLRLDNECIDLHNDLDRAHLDVDLAKHDLSEILAQSALWDQTDVEGSLEFLPVDVTLDQLLTVAMAHRPDWRAAERSVEQARARLRLAQAQRAWDINAGPMVAHVPGVNDGLGVIFSVQPQVFDRNQGAIHKAKADVEHSLADQSALGLAIEKETRQAYERYRVNHRIVVNYLHRYLVDSRSAMEQSQRAYEQGHLGLTDYLDTLRTYRKIHFGYRAALADYLLALTAINLACGADVTPVDRALTVPQGAVGVPFYLPDNTSTNPSAMLGQE